jgi:phosphoribosylpyrophosphate synthetase
MLVDDMIDTGFGESRRFNDGKGALSVRAICTHAIYLEMLRKNRKV